MGRSVINEYYITHTQPSSICFSVLSGESMTWIVAQATTELVSYIRSDVVTRADQEDFDLGLMFLDQLCSRSLVSPLSVALCEASYYMLKHNNIHTIGMVYISIQAKLYTICHGMGYAQPEDAYAQLMKIKGELKLIRKSMLPRPLGEV